MGLSMRTDLYRFTRWAKFDTNSGRPSNWSPFNASDTSVKYELYNHAHDDEADFDAFENVNLATDPAHLSMLMSMDALLMTEWDGGHLNPPAPSPPPLTGGMRYAFAATTAGRTSSCLAVTNVAIPDAVVVQPCGASSSSSAPAQQWVTHDFTASATDAKHEELENVGAPTHCLNLFGGVPRGCKAGSAIHMNECSAAKAGNYIQFNSATGQFTLPAATQCAGMCVSVDSGTTNVVLAACSDATKWEKIPL